MYCLHPILVAKYGELSDGIKVKTKSFHYVPCGSCVSCLSRKRSEWTFRLSKESEKSSYALFCTLTYDNDHIPIKVSENKPYFVFDKKQVQDYLKRCRYFFEKIGVYFRYFLVSEYGERSHRPHYHMLAFVRNDNEVRLLPQVKKILADEWHFGMYNIQPVSLANIHYCTKYCLKGLIKRPDDCLEDCFTLQSKRPYIGADFEQTLELQSEISDGEPTVLFNGCRQAMPRIYRQKLGVKSLHGESNDYDLRLSNRQYERICESIQTQDVGDISREINRRLSILEDLSIKRQNTRNEKGCQKTTALISQINYFFRVSLTVLTILSLSRPNFFRTSRAGPDSPKRS